MAKVKKKAASPKKQSPAPAKSKVKASAKPAAKAVKAAPVPTKKTEPAKKSAATAKPEAPAATGKKGKDVPAPRPSMEPARKGDVFMGPMPDKPMPRASKLPAPAEPLTKREMEQVLTVGVGRGVMGEGSLKGRLFVHLGFPYLEVIGRDKRELFFLLQGPDQEVLPAYVDHKVSVSGFIRRTNNHGGMVDVRKYSAKKPEAEVIEVPEVQEAKLRYLSPGEVEQVCSSGMAAGVKGFATMRGTLEMTGDSFFLVVSAAGTRQQVSFTLEGKGAKGLRKMVGHLVQATGVVEKTSGWGGTFTVETVEVRGTDYRLISRDAMEVAEVEARGESGQVEAKLNHGLSVRLPERAGYIWAVEPTTAKRVSLREANFELKGSGPATREFFFTPRNPGQHDVEFFLAKAFNPTQVAKTYKLNVMVKG
ncbi:MAG: protease inhibitor I42 family protein [Myxococcaceae bacterium]|nr:protease inhibitor I42 family protein [Myxococcaceae bacterium]